MESCLLLYAASLQPVCKAHRGGYQEENPDINGVKAASSLHDCAFVVFPLLLDAQRHTGGLCEGLVDSAVLHGRALEVSGCAYSLGDFEALVVGNGGGLLARRVAVGCCAFFGLFLLLLAQIAFQGDQDQLDAGAVVGNLTDPFGFDVF